MSNNGINYPMYNNLSYPHIVQPPSLYAQQYSNTLTQPLISPYGAFSSTSSKPQQNTYDHLIQSAAKTLAAFTHPSELSTLPNQLSRLSRPTFSRRPTNNSSTNANSTRTYYCEICRIACGGHASYQAHLNGTKHKKKEQNPQQQQQQQQSNSNSNNFHCELCDISCTSSDAYQAHLDGNKHDKAMKLHRKLGKTIPSSVQESQSIVNTSEKPSIEDKTSQYIGMEYIETSYDESHVPKCYYCKLCDCKFHDANGRDAHLKGRRHRISYKKKVDPNFQVDSKESKVRSNEPIEKPPVEQQVFHQVQQQTELDDDTKYLMEFHQQIVPSQNLLDTIEEFVSAVENALKSCSDQLRPLSSSESLTDRSPLMGVLRVGSLVKNLLIKTDRLFHIVVICTEWPTKKLLQEIYCLLSENFQEQWIDRVKIDSQQSNETIQVTTQTNEGEIAVSIALTSLTVQDEHEEQISEEYLSKINCLNALNSMHSVRWFQIQVSKRPYACALLRCLRYKTKTTRHWHFLSSEIIEILIEQILSEPKSPIIAFRQVLEYLSGGLILSNGPGLRIPWQKNIVKNALDDLNDQERHDITHQAQIGLRYLAFGQLNNWLLGNASYSPAQKRFYSEEDHPISSKRRCTESSA